MLLILGEIPAAHTKSSLSQALEPYPLSPEGHVPAS